MNKVARDITRQDFETCTDIIKSFGVEVISYDNVWLTMFFTTNEWSLSLDVLKSIDEKLQEKTEFYLFSTLVQKSGDRTLELCVGSKKDR